MVKKLLGSIFAILLCAGTSYAQVKVTGTVTDAQGVVPGATVVLQGSPTKGTTTDAQGRFTLDIPDASKATLEIRFLGMDNVSLPLNGRTYVEVRMTESANQLDEIVVMGYGLNIRKGDTSGAVGTISGEVLERIPVANVGEALTGKLAGVQVTSVDGSPDAEITIRVRGAGSITGDNSPLYIVDGFPVDNLNDLPPSEIESLSVLKDASTTALYGARGANGVIVVTTKQAKGGKTTVNFNTYMQFRTLARALDVLDPYEFVMLQFEKDRLGSSNPTGFINQFGDPKDLYIYKGYEGTNWQKEAMKGSPLTQNYNVSINGGNEKTRFTLGLTHHNEKGVLVSNNLKRTNVNLKLNHELFKNLRLDYGTRFVETVKGGGGTGGSRDNGGVSIRSALRYRPTEGLTDFMDIPVITEDGDEELDPDDPNYVEKYSPAQEASQNYRKQVSYLFNTTAALNWTIIRGLSARSEFGIDYSFGYDDRYFGGSTNSAATYSNGLPMTEQTATRTPKYRWANTLTYIFDVKKDHHFRVMGGQEIIHSQKSNKFERTTDFPADIDPKKALANLGKGQPYTTTSSTATPIRTASFFGSLMYDYDRRFFLTATLRADGSTLFGPDNRWGYFPAAAASWLITNEEFMKQYPVVSNLKLRISYGSSGNNRISPDQYRQVYTLGTSKAPGWGEKYNSYYSPAALLYNPSVQWETKITRNIGIDFGLFNERISGTIDAYWDTTKDLLYETSISAVSGKTRQQKNVAQTSNRGVELTVNGQIVQKRDFNLYGTFNIGYNKYKIDHLASGESVWEIGSNWAGTSDIIGYEDYRVVAGKSLGLIYGYQYDGFYQVDEFDFNPTNNTYTLKPGIANSFALSGTPRPGNAKFKKTTPVDEKADDPYLITADDRTYIGDTNPMFSGGFTLSGNYKNFDFNLFFNFMYGFDVYNATKMSLSSFCRNSRNNLGAHMANRFRYFDDMGNDLRTDPVLLAEFNKDATEYNPISLGKQIAMDYIIEDGSFLRLNTASIGYTLPRKITQKIGMNHLRVYVTGYNLFLWTKYSGYDPEINVQTGLTPGVDYNSYPKSRTFTVGVNMKF